MSVQQLLDVSWVETVSIIGCDQVWVTPVTGPGRPASTPVRVPLTVSDAELAALIRTPTGDGPV